MKDVLYSLLGNISGNTKENLMTPVDKVDQVIHDAIEIHADSKAGAIMIAGFMEVYIPYFASKNDLKSMERISLSVNYLHRTVKMFS